MGLQVLQNYNRKTPHLVKIIPENIIILVSIMTEAYFMINTLATPLESINLLRLHALLGYCQQPNTA